MQPLTIEIIAYAPTQYFHCQHCELFWDQTQTGGVKKFHNDALETSMPPEMMQDYRTLSDWIIKTVKQHNGRVTFRVIDAASLEGVWKSLRYGVRKYPAFVIAGKEKLTGNDFAQVETRINQRLS
ncbi:MAG: hypothetical protein FJ009_08295 [Chloroflexi bacterium]|nr:hypothetical protein [Chloroflexota bacterium]